MNRAIARITVLGLLLTILAPMQLLADYLLAWTSPDASYLYFEDDILMNEKSFDMNGDGIVEIPIEAQQDNLPLFCFYSGAAYNTIVWSYTPPDTGSREYSFVAFADVDGDDRREAFFEYDIVEASRGVIAVDPETDAVEWELSEASIKVILDIDHDGYEEAVVWRGWPGTHYEIWSCDTANAVLDSPQRSTPVKPKLSQNYPNPFNPATTIGFQVQKTGSVRLSIYNSVGQLVRTLVDEIKRPGDYTVRWDGRNGRGVKVKSGTYFYQLIVGDFTSAKKAILLK